MPKFLSLLHFQPPFSYYCWQTTQRCCTQVSPQSWKTWLLQGHSKHWVGSAGFLCCVPGEAASCVEATGSKIHWKVFGTSIEGLVRSGYLLYRIPISFHFFLKGSHCSNVVPNNMHEKLLNYIENIQDDKEKNSFLCVPGTKDSRSSSAGAKS